MADVKTIQTRLQLKYDTYANWTDDTTEGVGANLVLLKGEIGICEIETNTAGDPNVAPTVLFKVGNGEKKFSELKWASATAADVYSWAKASDVVFDEVIERDDEGAETGRKHYIRFKSGDTVVKELDLSTFITDAEVNAIVGGINARLANIEAALGVDGGEGTGSVADQISDITDRLDAIEGEDGAIAKAVADANDYTDSLIGKVATETEEATGIRKEIADAVAAEKAVREAAEAAQATKDSEQDTAISDEAKARDAADKAINDKIGGSFTAESTVADAITAAADAASVADGKAVAAQNAVDALTAADGQVTANTADIAQLKTDLAAETANRTNADAGLDTRLKKVEAFFEGAAEDSEGLNNALDTLVEIQNLLSMEDGAAAGELLDAVTALQEVVGDAESGLVKDMTDAKTNIGELNDDVADLQDIVDGYSDKGSVKTAIDAAQAQADKGVEDAGKAQAAADQAQREIDALELVVGTEAEGTVGEDGYKEATGLVKRIDTANATAVDAQTRVAALEPRVEQAEKDIDALEAIVSSGDNTNAKLREAITALEEIVVTGADANATLGGEIDAIAAKVNNETTGLAAAYATADDAQKRVAAIEADYLKAADVYVFNCGSSTTVTHTVPAN